MFTVSLMDPIDKLLNRIKWDKEFGNGYFEIGYEDHIEQKIFRVSFRSVNFSEDQPSSFQVKDEQGKTRTIPFHRIREVYKDGRLIWKRLAVPIPR